MEGYTLKVYELISVLQEMPQNMDVLTMGLIYENDPSKCKPHFDAPSAEQVWDDKTQNFVVIL